MVRLPNLANRAQRSIALCALVALLLSLTVNASDPALAAGSSGTVTWQDPFNMTANNSIKSVQPWVTIDGYDIAHVLYRDGSDTSGSLVYRNNLGGVLNKSAELEDKLGVDTNPFFAIATAPDNSLIAAYSRLGRDNYVYYRRGTRKPDRSAVFGERQLVYGSKSYQTNVVVDHSGVAHVVWLDGSKNVFYRRVNPDGSMSPLEYPKRENIFQQRPQIAVTNDGRVHIVFERGEGKGAEIWYYRREPDGKWVGQNLSASSGVGSFDPTITTDGGAGLFVAWDENVNHHDVLFRRSNNGGQSWSNRITMSSKADSLASAPYVSYSDSTKRVYVAWHEAVAENADSNTDIWLREFDPATDITSVAYRVSNISGASTLPVVAVGHSRGMVVWTDKPGSQRQSFAANGVTQFGLDCTGTLALENGAIATNKTTLTGTISVTNCSPNPPTQMKVAVGGDPTTSTPAQAFQSSIQVPIGAVPQCGAKTVSVQLIGESGPGTPARDSIVVDTNVSAAVHAYNPDSNEGNGPSGANGGDPNFTNDANYILGINDTGDCVGLKNVTVNGGAPIALSGPVTLIPQQLPNATTQGLKTVTVTVADQLGNTQSYQGSIVLDTQAPTLASGGKAAASTENSIMRTLSFSDISVNDNLYGTTAPLGPTLPAGKRFWGVAIVNSRTQINPITATGLNWAQVGVSPQASDFTVDWSIWSGLGYNPTATDKSGDYYTYVRFLDGAGNMSTGYLTLKTTLTPGYSVPTLHMPAVRR